MDAREADSEQGRGRRNVLVPWVEKFRPKSINDMVSQDAIVSAMKKFLEVETVCIIMFLISISRLFCVI